MSEEKLLSVVIPIYNTAPYLKRCISSIQGQTYQKLEIICVDNGSSDNSLQILKEFEKDDSRIVVLEEKKKGVSAARNCGLKSAKGEYITFVDSDDAVLPDMYRTLIDILERERADISHCGYRRFEPDGSYRDISGTGEYLTENKWEAINHLLRGEKYTGSLWNKIYKGELFQGLSLDEELVHNEDFLLNYQLFNAAEKTVFLDKPFYLYYIRKESASSSRNASLRSRNALSVSEKVWQLFRNTEVKEAAANKYYYDLVCSYRNGIFEKKSNSDKDQQHIRNGIANVESTGIPIAQRNRMDFRLMYFFPTLYRSCYSIYNRIRKPNWDVK